MASPRARAARQADKTFREEVHKQVQAEAAARAAAEIDANTVTLSDGSKVHVPGSYHARRRPDFVARVAGAQAQALPEGTRDAARTRRRSNVAAFDPARS